MSRRLAHLVALVMLLAAFLEPVRIIPAVHARSDPALDPAPRPSVHLPLVPRSQLSTRDPLPTPVPIDPDATPIPGPFAGTDPAMSPLEEGPPRAATGLVWPVAGVVSQYFSAAHPALDIAAPYGTPVVAAASGTVTFSGWRENGGGYQVHIDAGWASVGVHHLSAVYVTGGTYVSAGTVIGAIGCTGLCSGPHTHFSLLIDGAYVDPLGWL